MSSGSYKIALVIDGDKGIGYEIVKKLCEEYSGTVYFTSDNSANGKSAEDELKKDGLTAKNFTLDITKYSSITLLLKTMRYTEGEINLLINASELKLHKPYKDPLPNVAFEMLNANYEGAKNLIKEFFYIMKRGGLVLNVSSEAGYIENIPNIDIRKKLESHLLTISKLDNLVEEYKTSISHGSHIEDGWGDDPYVVSKVFLTALTCVHQRYAEELNRSVIVKCINSGYSLFETKDVKTLKEMAEVVVSAALDTADKLKGSFIC